MHLRNLTALVFLVFFLSASLVFLVKLLKYTLKTHSDVDSDFTLEHRSSEFFFFFLPS